MRLSTHVSAPSATAVTAIETSGTTPTVTGPSCSVPDSAAGSEIGFGRAEIPFWNSTFRSSLTAKLVIRSVTTLEPRIARNATRSIARAATTATPTPVAIAAGAGSPSASDANTP